EKFKKWTEANPDNREAINELYDFFDKNPCALENGHNGREKDNGFKIAKARHIMETMPEVKHIFTEEYLNEVVLQSEHAKTRSSKAILSQLNDYKNHPHQNHIELVML